MSGARLLRLPFLVAVPVAAGAFLSDRPREAGWVPAVGEAVRFDDGSAERDWVVVRRLDGVKNDYFDLRRGDDATYACLDEIRPAGWGLGR